uniref:BTB domain-containing protein n=1 Tax=Clastoptera arizonana TaxID=38151 RepID=A0A1B6DX45_9HEMI
MALTSQRFCLRWNNHQSNLLSVFDQLLHDEAFVDVTLAVEGQLLRAHKMVLSACSPYFQALFVGHPDKHPIVILKDVPYADMRSLLDFMYRGEVSVDQDRLTAFLKVAESLRIKGLTEVNEERCDLPSIASSLLSSTGTSAPPPPPHLHRIHVPKRVIPPMAANPLLGSALTAPKRKRGRPRKLSGSGGDNPGASPEDEGDTEMRLHHPNRADSPAMGPPDLLEVNMREMNEVDHNAKEGDSGAEDNSVLNEADDTDGQVKNDADQEPTPGTSTQESPQSFKGGNSSQDSERFGSGVNIIKQEIKCEYDGSDNKQQLSEEEYYDDIIACSPGTSEDESENGSLKKQTTNNNRNNIGWKQELSVDTDEMMDEDISQYELDSFKAMMSSKFDGPISPNLPLGHFDPNKPIDKASVRRYCTHEAENVYRCNVCGKTYTHISNFCRHFLSTHHGVKQEIPCPVCFKLFTRKDNMMTHIKQVHRMPVMRGNFQPSEAGDHSNSDQVHMLNDSV